MLAIGLIGLPNVGKSTLFNALTSGHASVSNYPFTTIDSNVGMVPVPDARLLALEEVLAPSEATPCTIRFVDVAGLVAGASQGEGLGNQFLGNLRGVDALAHVLRAFPETDVAHVQGRVDPVRDAEVIETELLLADLDLVERAVGKRQHEWQTRPRQGAAERQRLERWCEALADGTPLRRLALEADDRAVAKELGLLTAKPLLYVLNVGEGDPPEQRRALAERLRGPVAGERVPVVEVSAKLEGELAELEPAERRELMPALGLAETGLERLVAASFELLGLLRFYTVAHGKLRAWEVPRGTRAPEAAGKVHSDMEAGFIRAQVASCEEVLEHGSFQELHRLGRLRTEGKSYVIEDGDVVEFLFSG